MEYNRAVAVAASASASSAAATFLALNVALVVNGVAGSTLYASGAPYSYQYQYPYALAYSYTQHSPVLSANHLLQLKVNYDDTSPPSTTDAVLDEESYNNDDDVAETPLIDASVDITLDDGGGDDEDDASQQRYSGTESKEIPGNQSSASEPPIALGEQAPLPDATLLPQEGTESPFLEETSLTALGEHPAQTTEESDELNYYYPSLPATYTNPKPLLWPKVFQFYTQDGFGHYNYGYANEHSSKQEFKLLDGITRGAYNYIDAEGKLQTISYVSSDGEGFRVAATNLPHPVDPVEIPDSPDVAAAKAAHLQAQFEAVANVNRANNVPAVGAGARADAGAGASANASGDNVVSGCNETSEVKR